MEAETGKKRQLEVDSLEFTTKSRKISIDSSEIPKNAKNWNDLPVELKLICIGKMTEKTKVKLSMCSKFDQKVVKSERKKLKMVWLKEEFNIRDPEGSWSHKDDVFKCALWTTDNSGQLVLKRDKKCPWPADLMVTLKIRNSCHQLLLHYVTNYEIDTLKLEIALFSNWIEPYSEFVEEPRKVENLELKWEISFKELFETAMTWKPYTLRLCGYGSSRAVTAVVKGMVDLNFEIGQKIELSLMEPYIRSNPTIFGPSDEAETIATQVNATLIVNEEKYFRLSLKNDLNKHIIALNRPNKTIELAVVSKDLAEIPDTFF